MHQFFFAVALGLLSVAVIALAMNRNAVRALGSELESLPRNVDARLRDELRQHRAESSEFVHRLSESLVHTRRHRSLTRRHNRLQTLRAGLERQVQVLKTTVDDRLRTMQDDNAAKLDHAPDGGREAATTRSSHASVTSFRQVSERLEQV